MYPFKVKKYICTTAYDINKKKSKYFPVINPLKQSPWSVISFAFLDAQS